MVKVSAEAFLRSMELEEINGMSWSGTSLWVTRLLYISKTKKSSRSLQSGFSKMRVHLHPAALPQLECPHCHHHSRLPERKLCLDGASNVLLTFLTGQGPGLISTTLTATTWHRVSHPRHPYTCYQLPTKVAFRQVFKKERKIAWNYIHWSRLKKIKNSNTRTQVLKAYSDIKMHNNIVTVVLF